MKVLTKDSAPRYSRDDITSYLLVSEGTCESKGLAITVVEMEPGGMQPPTVTNLSRCTTFWRVQE